MKLPRLLIIGHARHGKDTVAEILRDEFGYSFQSSSFWCAERVMIPYFASRGIHYADLAECYADRVNHRQEWFEQIAAYNTPDRTRLIREMFDAGHNIYCGMRNSAEFEQARHVVDHVIWVDASGRGIPPEPRSSFDITYDPVTMKLIDNSGDLDDLRFEVMALQSGIEFMELMAC